MTSPNWEWAYKLPQAPGLNPSPTAKGPSESPSFTLVFHIWRFKFGPWIHSNMTRIHEFQEFGSAASCRFLRHDLFLPGSYIPSSFSSVGFPELDMGFVFLTLHMVSSVTEWKHYNDYWDIYQSDCRGNSVWAPCPPLLGTLAGVILVGSWKFP